LRKEITYLSEQNPLAAQRVAAAFFAAWERISRHPDIGPKGDLPGTRLVIVGAYVVTIRKSEGLVEIVAVRHGRQADARSPAEVAVDASHPDTARRPT
jgi:plasmid stabilization system protein ParE